jgi:hypothetical protein
MSWGYHTIFSPHKYTGRSRLPPHPRNADNNNAADNNADDTAADNNADDNSDVNADNKHAMQTTDNNADATRCRQWTTM